MSELLPALVDKSVSRCRLPLAYTECLVQGGMIVTADPQQARALQRLFAADQAEDGFAAWATARIVPWDAWLERMLLSLSDRPTLFHRASAARLWLSIVTDSAVGSTLVTARAAAAEAARAWQRLADWQMQLSAVTAATPEQSTFGEWLRSYSEYLRAGGFIDAPAISGYLCKRITDVISQMHASSPAYIGFHGFACKTKARIALMSAFESQGIGCRDLEFFIAHAQVVRQESATPESEFVAAAHWAAERLSMHPGARLGILVPDLAQHSALMRRVMDDVLAPNLKTPGAPDARPYSMEGGHSLMDAAVVVSALGVLSLASESIDVLQFGALLRSPYLRLWPSGSDLDAGARVDVALRDLALRKVPLAEVCKMMRASGAAGSACAALIWSLHERLAQGDARRLAEYADEWPKVLRLAGWPLGRTISLNEESAARRVYEALGLLAGFDTVLPPLRVLAAVGEFEKLLATQRFEAASQDAPISILDGLTEPGVAFDGLWVCGLSADRFPAGPTPNPFLPLALQVQLKVPGASAAISYQDAARTLTGWSTSTYELVLSVAREEGDAHVLPSRLIDSALLPFNLVASPVVAHAVALRKSAILTPRMQGALPPLAAGVAIAGGVGVLKAQSACAFQGAVTGRLHARPLESPKTGIQKRVRGTLAHDALNRFWQPLNAQHELLALSPQERAAAVSCAIDAALRHYKSYLPKNRLMDLEREWLQRALTALIDAELLREPFRVIARETPLELSLAGHPLHVRPDRIDQFDATSDPVADEAIGEPRTMVIDYKTGKGVPSRWFGLRPDSLQLAIYAGYATPAPCAVAVAQLALSVEVKKKFQGYADRQNRGLQVRTLGAGKAVADQPATWELLLAQWRAVSERLAMEYARGDAAVNPMTGTCDHCHLANVCRIDRGANADDIEDDDAAALLGEDSSTEVLL